MNHEIVAERKVTICNPQGLHLRPADKFARTANGFKSQINLVKDGERVDGKSILSIVTLMATQGTELAIEARGPDAHDALEALVTLVEQGFSEMEDETNGNGSGESAATVEVRPAEGGSTHVDR